ncbi:MAG: peptidylprolyl isomerase [Bacteroidota bacterium]
MLRLMLLSLLCLCFGWLSAQVEDDAVLFTVDDKEVTVGEFRYIYTKSNAEQADFSEASLREYLELYERFKLKVTRAYEMGLDTVRSLQQELDGYRRQLADNYLIDRSVTDKLVEEMYERKQQDVDFSHILIRVGDRAIPEDTLEAYRRIQVVASQLNTRNFSEIASSSSEDNRSKGRGGRIGFIPAPMPSGFYALETLLHEGEIGEVLGPVRSKVGYHMVIVHERRPTVGEIEAAHIWVQKNDSNESQAREKIERALALLNAGTPFEQVSAEMSEDARNAENGGYIGWFGLNKYEDSFEEAAFALETDGAISPIVETSAGFHILRRIAKRGVQPLSDERPLLERAVKADTRYTQAIEALLLDIRQRANVSEDRASLERWTRTLVDSAFLHFRWSVPTPRDESPLLLLGENGETVYTMADFQDYLASKARERMSAGRVDGSRAAVDALYPEWVRETLLAYEETKLEERYPEFRALMREYEEGILLFEATKVEVWDRAASDSTGLAAYFADHRDDYIWEERAAVTLYQISGDKLAQQSDIYEFAQTHSPDEVLSQFGRDNLNVQEDTYERGRLPQLGDVEWANGETTSPLTNPRNGTITFYKIEEVLPGGRKELDEARGYVIADYQDQLEEEWVDGLRSRFPIKLNRRIFNKLVQD